MNEAATNIQQRRIQAGLRWLLLAMVCVLRWW